MMLSLSGYQSYQVNSGYTAASGYQSDMNWFAVRRPVVKKNMVKGNTADPTLDDHDTAHSDKALLLSGWRRLFSEGYCGPMLARYPLPVVNDRLRADDLYDTDCPENAVVNSMANLAGQQVITVSAEMQCRYPRLVWEYLLPLLRAASQQRRWQLWFTGGKRLRRSWLQQVNLPLEKTIQVSQLHSVNMVRSMINALTAGNCSMVVGYLSVALANEYASQLYQAAQAGNSRLLICLQAETPLPLI